MTTLICSSTARRFCTTPRTASAPRCGTPYRSARAATLARAGVARAGKYQRTGCDFLRGGCKARALTPYAVTCQARREPTHAEESALIWAVARTLAAAIGADMAWPLPMLMERAIALMPAERRAHYDADLAVVLALESAADLDLSFGGIGG